MNENTCGIKRDFYHGTVIFVQRINTPDGNVSHLDELPEETDDFIKSSGANG